MENPNQTGSTEKSVLSAFSEKNVIIIWSICIEWDFNGVFYIDLMQEITLDWWTIHSTWTFQQNPFDEESPYPFNDLFIRVYQQKGPHQSFFGMTPTTKYNLWKQ